MSNAIFGKKIDRRTVLRGLGATVALPALDAMTPALAAAGPAAAGPMRMAWIYVPNGMHMEDFTPSIVGKDFKLPETLQPLADFRSQMMVLSGLTADKARANGDGAGDHARAMAAFLTGSQPRKTGGSNIRAGISADQVAAQKAGHLTRLPSLEIGLEGGRNSGACDSGYACAYQNNLSWRSEGTPMPKEVDPAQLFDRLFGSGAKLRGDDASRREAKKKSILDFVRDDAKRLSGELGGPDRGKVEEYLESVRDVERRIASVPKDEEKPFDHGYAKPKGVPHEFSEHSHLLADLLVLAFRADITRISTFVFANDGSNRNYPTIGVSDGHHDLSHHQKDAKKQAKIKKINLHHMESFAYFIRKLKEAKEGDATLLDRSMIVYGSGIGDGDRHNHDELPILLMGGGAGKLKTGRHVRFPKETPLTNLYLAMLERFGAKTSSLGDSTGILQGLS